MLATIPLSGHDSIVHKQKLQEDFSLALKYVRASDTDSARVLLNHVVQQLSEQQEFDTYLGLSARLHLANILIPEREDFASRELINLIEIGTARKEWEIVAHAHILLGMIYETLGDKETCQQHLGQAELLIDKHQLESLYPRYAIGRSSYFRVFKLSQDSALFYAKEALNNVPAEPCESKAAAYFLIGLLSRDSSYTYQIAYLTKSAEVYLELGDYYGHAAMINNITRTYYDHQQMDSALVYSDSTLLILQQLKSHRYHYFSTKSSAFKLRAELYKLSGRMEEAWQYNEISHQSRLEYVNKLNAKAITEVEERFKDEKKTQQIEQQVQQIQFEKARRNGALMLAITILIFTVILIYFYYRLFKANKKNKAQAEHLAKLDQIKSRFFANVSHELRTPLTLLLGPINSLLKENRLAPQEMEFLRLAHKNGRQLEQLINEILNLRKLEMEKLELQLEGTQLKAFLLPYLTQFESLAYQKSIDFSYQVEVDYETAVMIDREKYRQILYNLLSNSFKYTPWEGKIHARIAISQGRLKLEVKDNGPGIHPDDMPYIFDRYFQTNRSEKPAEGGIGLALCREYAQLMQGNIRVESAPGVGTLFTVTIPTTTIDAPMANEKTPDLEYAFEKTETEAKRAESPIFPKLIAPTTQSDAKPHLLVVEDNLDLQDYIRMVLSEKYQITTAMNGEEALKTMAAANPYHLIISDLMMPVMDGFQFLERIKSSDTTRHIPFIMLTARAAVQDKLKALRIGVDDYLLKPFQEEELVARIDNLLCYQEARKKVTLTDDQSSKKSVILSKVDQKWLASFEAYIRENIASDLLSVSIMAGEFAMSESTLLRQLKGLTGLSPRQYLQEVRLNEARRLLENGAYRSIAQVAEVVGYREYRSFSRIFKKRFGKLPSELQVADK